MANRSQQAVQRRFRAGTLPVPRAHRIAISVSGVADGHGYSRGRTPADASNSLRDQLQRMWPGSTVVCVAVRT